MRRLLILILSAFIILAPLTAVEWGGYVDNNSTILGKGGGVAFNQSNSLFLWVSTPLNENGNIYIKGEGMYKYNFDTATKNFSNFLDLDLLKFVSDFTLDVGTINIYAGRFNFSDLTGTIFSQTSDGIFGQFIAQSFGASLYVGFTGLLNSNTVNMLDSEGNVFEPENEIYALSPSFISVFASISMPSLFLNQTLSFQASGIFDVSDLSTPANAYNRMYATIDFTGPLSSTMFYSMSTSFGTANFGNLMNYSNFSLSILPTNTLLINAGFLYASGEHLGMKPFNGFSSHPAYNASIDFQTTSSMIPSLSANISLLQDTMLLSLTGKGVFSFINDKSKTNAVEARGIQGDLSTVYNIFPDLQVGISATLFKAFEDASLDKFSATFKFAVTF